MRMVSTFLITAVFLGVGTSDGWCPEPANLGAPLGASNGATGQAIYTSPGGPRTYEPGQDKRDPRNMSQSQRLSMVGREKLAGRLKTPQEVKNFIQTGDARLSYTPPPPKTFVKPKSMSDAQWQRVLATRPGTPNYVSGTYFVPGSGRSLEQNANRVGGTLTTTVANPSQGKPAPPANPIGYKPVTKLGVHRTP